MTRFAWLQTRTQTLGTAALLAVLAVVAAITGLQLAHLYSSISSSCHALGDCSGALSRFTSHDDLLQTAFDTLMRPVPALLGIFWGAPLLAREFETGTVRLAWTQGVTRSRWLLTKLAVGAGATAAIAGLLTLTVTWWFRAIDHVGANQYANFEARDIAPIGYAIFAFAVGALAGAVIRRTVPAMATTLAVFVAVRVPVAIWVRPHLFAPLRLMTSLAATRGTGFISANGGPVDMNAGTPNLPNSWIVSTSIVTAKGYPTTFGQRAAFLRHCCPAIANAVNGAGPPGLNRPPPGPNNFQACLAHASRQFAVLTTYQPAHRYLPLQWAEFGIFMGLALLAALACYWWVVRRAT